MTDYAAILRELQIAGYEGAHLLAAFERMCAAIGSVMRNVEIPAPVPTLVRHASAPSAPPHLRQTAKPAVVVAKPAPVAHKPPAHAKSVGRTALSAMGLSGRAVAVGSQLLQHYNVATGRCDPGIGSLVKSTNMPRRAVQRAIAELQHAGAFAVVQNGGQRHANRYLPQWPSLVEIAAGVTASAPDLTRRGDKSGAQNLGKKPDSIPVSVKAQGVRRKASAQADRRQLEIMMPIPGGRPPSAYAAIADTEARNRLRSEMSEHLRGLFPTDKAGFAAAIQRAWEVDMAAVLAAEIARKGSGMAVWLRLLGWGEDRAAG